MDATENKIEDVPVSTTGTSKKKLWIVAAILLLAVVTGGVGYYLYKGTGSSSGSVDKKDIAQLSVGLNGEIFDLGYPKAETAITPGQVVTNGQVYEGLVRYEDLTKITPLLATNWTNPAGLTNTWDFTLKKNVKFHTGHTMTAADVKYSIEAMIASGTDTAGTFASTIKKVSVLSPYKVRIETDGADPLLLNKLTSIYIIDSKSTKKNDPINGTGPYYVKSGVKQTEAKLDLAAFDQYHGGRPHVRHLIIKNYDSYEATAKAIEKKQVDIGGDVPNDLLSPLKKSGYKIIVDDSPVTLFFGFRVNKKNSPVAKKEVREALQLAIDRKDFFKKTGVSGAVVDQIIPKQLPGYDPSIKPVARDVAKAKQLLTSAGYPNGITIAFYHFSNINDEALASLKASAAEVGITIDTHVFPDEDNYSATIDADIPDVVLSGWASAVNDGIDFFNTGVPSHTGITDPTYTSLYKAAEVEFNPQKRIALMQQASRYIADNVVVIPAYSKTYYAVSAQPSYYFRRDIAGTTMSFYYSRTYDTRK